MNEIKKYVNAILVRGGKSRKYDMALGNTVRITRQLIDDNGYLYAEGHYSNLRSKTIATT